MTSPERSSAKKGEELLRLVREQIVGHSDVIETPFGKRKLSYCDFTASGRAVGFIEDYIRDEVLPFYGNTHTTTSFTGHQTMIYREEARSIIAECCHADTEKDAVIFAGRGVTGVVNLFVRALRLCPKIEMSSLMRPVVFIGPQEHHSNILPWRESICEVVQIAEDPETGVLDLKDLEAKLVQFKNRPLRIGSFSAASNITGMIVDTLPITKLLHEHGALSFWDYAAAGPYMEIEMSPKAADGGEESELYHKDAIFISPHKFVGGVGTPGILIAKKKLFDLSCAPVNAGGGTVQFVTTQDHCYINDVQEREEGGTPDIVGCIKAGLTFQLKQAIGTDLIMKREHALIKRALGKWGRNPHIQILGPATCERLTTVSLLMWHRSGRMLHYNFISSLLNDLFGIQSRGGCACAGPYAAELLNIRGHDLETFKNVIVDHNGVSIYKPGFVRVSFNYLQDDRELDFVIDAVDWIAREGHKLLPLYELIDETNECVHVDAKKKQKTFQSLRNISISSAGYKFPGRDRATVSYDELAKYLEEANSIARRCIKQYKKEGTMERLRQWYADNVHELDRYRWFVLPSEAFDEKVEIDEEKNNFRHSSWRKKIGKFCPFVPQVHKSMADLPRKGVPDCLRQ